MIYTIGDSFTYGDELADKNLAWPYQLGKKLSVPVINKGRNASGNYRIVKRTIDAVLLEKPSFIVIGWTDPARQEFSDDLGITDIWAGKRFRDGQYANDHRINLMKYMTAYDVPEYYYRQWLRQIILIQNLCQNKNIRCIMFSACNAEQYHIDYQSKNQDLINHIDTRDYIGWFDSGSSVWTYGVPHGPGGHFLEEGHEIVADKIFDHIKRIV